MSIGRTVKVNLAVTVDVRLSEHVVHLLLRELLAQVGHHVPQFRPRDEPVTVRVKHLIHEIYRSSCIILHTGDYTPAILIFS